MKTKLNILLTAGLLAACSSDNETQPEAPVRHIRVVVNERPMISNEAKVRGAETRAEITTTSTLKEFKMYGIDDFKVSKTDYGEWKIVPDAWPEGSDEVSFYAYTDGRYSTDGTPHIEFGPATVSESSFHQHDLLVAKNTASCTRDLGTVSLTFDHACAAVAFYVKMSNKVKTNLGGQKLTVNSIVLRNVNYKGKYYYNNDDDNNDDDNSGWQIDNDYTYYTLHDGNIDITTEYQALPCNYLFLIPQSRDADDTNGTYLEVTYTIGTDAQAQTQKTVNIPIAPNWKAGWEYTINILLGTSLIK